MFLYSFSVVIDGARIPFRAFAKHSPSRYYPVLGTRGLVDRKIILRVCPQLLIASLPVSFYPRFDLCPILSGVAAASFFFTCKCPVMARLINWPVSPFHGDERGSVSKGGELQIPPSSRPFRLKPWRYLKSVYFVLGGTCSSIPLTRTERYIMGNGGTMML